MLGVQDFAFMGGSMGMAVGAAFVAGARAAIEDRCPYVIVTAAGGARMQEGILSLMQMPKATVAIAELKEAGLPYIVLLTDPTTGGVTASYAMLGDVQIAEPGALIGFAGQRVIESTIREKLPEGFQRAEYLLDHGMIDMVVHRKDAARPARPAARLSDAAAAGSRSERRKRGGPRQLRRSRASRPSSTGWPRLSPGATFSASSASPPCSRSSAIRERALPPVLHVAGTNGKGSTCAFLRAAIEAAGLKVHVYTSPHLVRFNERIRLAGRLIEDEALAALLAEVLDAAGEMELELLRGDHRRRLPRLRPHARRRLHRRGRARRPARRDQCDRGAARLRHRPARPSTIRPSSATGSRGSPREKAGSPRPACRSSP